MSKEKKSKNNKPKKNRSIIKIFQRIGIIISVPLAIVGGIQSTQGIMSYLENNNKKALLYTAVEIIGKKEQPKDKSKPNLIKAKVTVTNNGNAAVQLDSSLMVYVINHKTNNQSPLPAKLVKLTNKNSIISRNPVLLDPDETIVYETSFYEFDNWFSHHNQYLVHLYSKDNDFISSIKPLTYEKAEEMAKSFTFMDGIMKHHFGNINMPKSEAEPIQKVVIN